MSQLLIPVHCNTPMQLCSYLRGHAGISARLLNRLKHQNGGILCNGNPIRVIDTVKNGDLICLDLQEASAFTPNPKLCVPVVYENESVVIYNKPANMPVHPSPGHYEDTLGNYHAARYPNHRFHAVFRLDRNTSGLCAIAKTAYAAHHLHHAFTKRYYALVPPDCSGSGTISAPIGRVQDSVITRCVRADGKEAVTHYRTLIQTPQCALVELMPQTGRTHQIRVHMAHLGFPLLGDDLYGGDCTLLQSHALHCGMLSFCDPITHHLMTLTAPLRQEMLALLPHEISLFP